MYTRSKAGANRRYNLREDAPTTSTRPRTRSSVTAIEEEEEPEPEKIVVEEFENVQELPLYYDDLQYAAPNCGEVMEGEDAVQFEQIGSHVERQNFSSNAELINVTPLLTSSIPAVSMLEFVGNGLPNEITPHIRNTLVGLAVMTNRLIFENRYLDRELQALKKTNSRDRESQFDDLVFKKELIRREYVFPGGDEIPAKCLNDIVDDFDQNSARRNENALNTIRRFVKYLLEHTIPKDLRPHFTVRERGGYEHLKELPADLTSIVKEICLEAVGLGNTTNKVEEDRRNDLSETIFKFMKFALQELRRLPRKSKASRNHSDL
ncbi:hypothetical protein M3Y94_00540400 [Aphelenchoides besseyi]|nr:hypothetical protein M3Y94_00540400 [Aphelenchoides besseyi]